MKKYIITIDLGTTNIKTAVFDSDLHEVCVCSDPVEYLSSKGMVEFDPELYWRLCKGGIHKVIQKSGIHPEDVLSIALTGQAESCILLNSAMKPLRKGISWMDTRSQSECELLKRTFGREEGYAVTGQPEIITTRPITKYLWIKKNEKAIFSRVHKFLLLKDFIIFKLTGKLVAEYTVYNFSYYLDIVKKQYWKAILDFAGIETEQLPELIEPGETAGNITTKIAEEFHFSCDTMVNTGALDHFAGMIGTGNVREGMISETTGTVLAIATMVAQPFMNTRCRIPCHYNAVKNSYVLLPVCESGGVSLEWIKKLLFPDESYEELERQIEKHMKRMNEIIFLPYLTGTNAPEFNPDARSVFYGMHIYHSKIDFVRAVMEGVAFLLKKNIEYLEKMEVHTRSLISLGGGSKSAVWNQIKADVTGKDILIPASQEATSLGAAILAGIQCGFCRNIYEAVEKSVKIKKIFAPERTLLYQKGYRKFLEIYERLSPVFNEK